MRRIPLDHWLRKTTVWNRSCVNNKALKVWKMPPIFCTKICTNPFSVKLWKGQCFCTQRCLLVCRGNNKSKNKNLISLVALSILLSDFQDDGQALTQWRVPYWRMSLYRKRPEHQSKLTIFICTIFLLVFCQGLIDSPQCTFLGLWSLEELCYKLHVTLLTSLTVNFANILSNL